MKTTLLALLLASTGAFAANVSTISLSQVTYTPADILDIASNGNELALQNKFNCHYVIKANPIGIFENKVWGGFYVSLDNDMRVYLHDMEKNKALSDKAASIKPGTVVYIVAQGIDSNLKTETSAIYSSSEVNNLIIDPSYNWCVKANGEKSLSQDELFDKRMFESSQRKLKELIDNKGLANSLPAEYALYQKTINQCSTYECKTVNSIAIMRQLNGLETFTPFYDKKNGDQESTPAPAYRLPGTPKSPVPTPADATAAPAAPVQATGSELEIADTAINAAWAALPADVRKAILPAQRKWIKTKEACPTEQCKIDMTKSRTEVLQQIR